MRPAIFIIIVVAITALIIVGVVFWKGNDKEPGTPTVAPDTTEDPLATGQARTGVKEFLPHPNPNDKDLDGLSDAEETELGTSDYEFDTDGDGLSDTDEINYWKTDPTNADTDGDGFSDSWEIISGYNPNGEGELVE